MLDSFPLKFFNKKTQKHKKHRKNWWELQSLFFSLKILEKWHKQKTKKTTFE